MFLGELLFDLLLGLDLLAFTLLLPAGLLVVEHVLNQLLNTLADSSVVTFSFRCLPDLVKPGKDTLVLLR